MNSLLLFVTAFCYLITVCCYCLLLLFVTACCYCLLLLLLLVDSSFATVCYSLLLLDSSRLFVVVVVALVIVVDCYCLCLVCC